MGGGDWEQDYPFEFQTKTGGLLRLHKEFEQGVWRVRYSPRASGKWYVYLITPEVEVLRSLPETFAFSDFLERIVEARGLDVFKDFKTNPASLKDLTRRVGSNFNFLEALGLVDRLTPPRTKDHRYARRDAHFRPLPEIINPGDRDPALAMSGVLSRLYITDVGPVPRLRMELGQRINLLAGDNGLGKTFLMEVIWWVLTRDWVGEPAWPSREADAEPWIEYIKRGFAKEETGGTRYNFAAQRWPVPSGPPDLSALVVYARVDGGFAVCDPARNHWPQEVSGEPPKVDRPPTYKFSATEVWDGTAFCNGLINDVAKWYFQRSEEWSVLAKVLKGLSPGPSEPLALGKPMRVSLDDPRDIPTLVMPYGVIPITHASAGVKRILGLAYLLVWAWHEHVEAARLLNWSSPAKHLVMLVDEVEAHLHPQWQRVIMPSLMQVVDHLRKRIELQVVASTHAPLVLASLETLFDPQLDRLFLFDLQGKQVKFCPLEWEPHGDVTSWLTSDAFGLDEARSLAAEDAIERAMEVMRKPDATTEELDQQERELVKVLADTDPTWLRWKWLRQQRLTAEHAG